MPFAVIVVLVGDLQTELLEEFFGGFVHDAGANGSALGSWPCAGCLVLIYPTLQSDFSYVVRDRFRSERSDLLRTFLSYVNSSPALSSEQKHPLARGAPHYHQTYF